MADPRKAALAAAWAVQQAGADAWNNYCQRFIENAYGTLGQYRSAAAAIGGLKPRRTLEGARPGDVVLFAADPSNQFNGHAGIYLGNGRMVSATPTGVRETGVTDGPFGNLFVGIAQAPDEWQGQASTAELEEGAQRILAAAAPKGSTTMADDYRRRLEQAEEQAAARAQSLQQRLDKAPAERKRLQQQIDAERRKGRSADQSKIDAWEAERVQWSSDAIETTLEDARRAHTAALNNLSSYVERTTPKDTAQTDPELAAQRRASAALDLTRIGEIQATLGPTLDRILAQTGVDEAQRQRILAMLPAELERERAATGQTQAQTERIRTLTPLEAEAQRAETERTRAATAESETLLPGRVAQQEAQTRLTTVQADAATARMKLDELESRYKDRAISLDEFKTEWDTWYRTNVEMPRQLRQQQLEEDRARRETEAQRFSQEVTRQRVGAEAGNAAVERELALLPNRVGPTYHADLAAARAAAARGETHQWNPASTQVPVPDLTAIYTRGAAEALKDISPAAAAMAGSPIPNYSADLSEILANVPKFTRPAPAA